MDANQRILRGLGPASAVLGVMSMLAVLAFHYPEYLTTPMLREIYQEAQVRFLLQVGMIVALATSATAVVLGSQRRLAFLGLSCIAVAWMAGGPSVEIEGDVQTGRFYLSLDWVLLDLVLIGTLFVCLERARRLKTDQPMLRRDWSLDLTHYVVNHLFNGAMVFLIFIPASTAREALGWENVAETLSGLPVVIQVPLIMAVTDLAQYWIHRLSHHWSPLWRFHRVHHSVEVMDWLAGSRLHFVDILVTRAFSLIPMTVLGFSEQAVNLYLPILALQSVFIHCNVSLPLGWLRKIVATPPFHHWHHTSDPELMDRNYSVSLPVFDLLFGTFHCPSDEWPSDYGLAQGRIDGGYVSHLLAPFLPASRT